MLSLGKGTYMAGGPGPLEQRPSLTGSAARETGGLALPLG